MSPYRAARRAGAEAAGKAALEAALAKAAGNQSAAARELGMDRSNFRREAVRLGILERGVQR